MSSAKAALHQQGKSLLIFFILLVAQLYAGGDWQASGSFKSSMFQVVRVSIDEAFDNGLTGQDFACYISTTLNNQFGRFWNVVSGKVRNLQYDAVLFGYAYKRHWFWINNYRDSKFVIVWKDYNCQEEFSYSWGDTTQTHQFPKGTTTNLYNFNTARDFFNAVEATADIWVALYSSVRQIEAHIQDSTVSAVGAYGGFSEIAVCICHLAGGEVILESIDSNIASQWFAFETREGQTPLPPILGGGVPD